MNILVDFTQIPVQRTGVGIYAEHLAKELPALLQPGDRLFLLAQDNEPLLSSSLNNHNQVELLTIPARWFRHRAALLLYEQALLPFVLAWHHIDVVHSLHYTFPLFAPSARAVTIHDLTFCLFPELHTCGRRLLFPFFIRRAMRVVECPIFVSRSTQHDAERLFGLSRHPGHVVPLGVSVPSIPLDTNSARQTVHSLGIMNPFLLFVGTLEPRKNLVRIIQAFERIAENHSDHLLVIAGKFGWHCEEIIAAMENSPVRARIRHLGFVTETQKHALLTTCKMLVYPSLYEGFGLPVLEAMVHGTPVITSNLSSMPEIAGAAALLVDPSSTEEIAEAMDRLASSPGLAEQLRKAGPPQAATFTWRKTAEATYVAYRSALNAHNGKGLFCRTSRI